ncbi:MAG: DUF2784 domain-containing protein, partial [Proteobacteria bacterium]|nr:DUF2784 domain-containing protein [Pseudomonadota bacterium]
TPIEQALREQAGNQAYSGGFIDHYIVPLIYPEDLTRTMQIGLGLFVLVFNVAVYAWVFYRLRRVRSRNGPGGEI